MTTRYVAATGKTGGSYDTKARPAPSVTEAIKVAGHGDVIEILDAAVYQEPELVIDKALTITSSHVVANPGINPADPAFKLAPLPTLAAKGEHRVLRVQGTAAGRAGFGPVVIRGIQIRRGRPKQGVSADPGFGAGGGLVVVDADQVSVEQCVITENHTRTQAAPPWSEADRSAMRQAVEDLAGEVFSPATVQFLNNLVAIYNVLARLAALPQLTPIDRSALISGFGKSFDSHLPPGRPNHWLAGQAFGGGVATVWASPSLTKCLIAGNAAEGRGAGVAVVGFGWPNISNCRLENNRSGNTGRRDGGGVGLEVCLPSKLGRNLTEIDVVRFLVGKINALRTVIASPATSISIFDLLDFGHWLINPASRPSFRGIKAVVLQAMRGRFDWHVLFYYAATITLSRHRWDAWEQAEVDKARVSAVSIRDCKIASNQCFDDGGGLYASVMSRVAADSSRFEGNRAAGMGGGIRLSMGSDGQLTGCTFVSNHAQEGGGIACRNVNLTLKDSTVGASTLKPPSPAGNLSAGGPGGGIALEVESEGALAGVPDLWTSILREVFLVHDVAVSVNGGLVSGNGAGFTPAGTRSPTAASSKRRPLGGGLFLVRGPFADAPAVNLEIPQVAKVIVGNVAVTRNYTSKVDNSKVSAADERCIQDIPGRKEWTETNDLALISGGTLRFKA
jgi:hypothetical protein